MPDPATLDRLKARIQALRAKTIDNGCTREEALSAAAKVADLLDRHDLALSDVELRAGVCVRVVHTMQAKKRMPLGDCIGAVAQFCDCRVWREKQPDGEAGFVFFGLPADAEAAAVLAGLIETAVRAELGRYKTSAPYAKVRHQDRHLANASFALGMVISIADRLDAMKAERDKLNARTGRALVVVKASLVDAELRDLGIRLQTSPGAGRMVAPEAFSAGDAAGGGFGIPSR